MSHQHLTDKYGLPESVKVQVKKDKGVLYAKLPEYPGCITMAKDPLDLVVKINDAILTYFQVPRNEALTCDFLYFPATKRMEKIKSFPQGVNINEQFNSYSRCYA